MQFLDNIHTHGMGILLERTKGCPCNGGRMGESALDRQDSPAYRGCDAYQFKLACCAPFWTRVNVGDLNS